jgi:hypothetical protein
MISIKSLASLLDLKLKFSSVDALLMARFIIEQPNEKGEVIYNEESEISRRDFKSKIAEVVPKYEIYNGFKMTNQLTKLVNHLEDKKSEIEDSLRELDERDTGLIPI